jgi:hypothetical protein
LLLLAFRLAAGRDVLRGFTISFDSISKLPSGEAAL